MSFVKTVTCPSCGAMLQLRGAHRTVKCAYCGTVSEVPDSRAHFTSEGPVSEQWKRWMLFFLAATVGIPTCLGLLGAVFGLGGGMLAAILSFLMGTLRQ